MRKAFYTLIITITMLLISCNSNRKYVSITQQALETLSQPEWERRTVGTDGNVKAGEYLADLIKGFG